MPHRSDPIPGAPCWIDLLTPDVSRSTAFYCDLLGWTAGAPQPELGGYLNFSKDDVLVAGCMGGDPATCRTGTWSVYLASEDVHKNVELATTHGAGVIVGPHPVGELGAFAMLTDPTGAAVGIWQAGQHRGFGLVGEPGAPAWFELTTGDYDAALEFYRTSFGWQTNAVSDTDEFGYSVLTQSGQELAGVMDAARPSGAGLATQWTVYFAVEDTDATVARVQQLGGTVAVPAQDTPYGRLASVADPNGAQFRIVAGSQS